MERIDKEMKRQGIILFALERQREHKIAQIPIGFLSRSARLRFPRENNQGLALPIKVEQCSMNMLSELIRLD